jgi:serine protease Do
LNIYYYADPFSIKPYIEKKKEKIWGWSGIIVSRNWYILTNKHVVSDLDADYSVVTKNWDVYKVDKIWTDPILDIAIIHVVWQDWSLIYDLQPAKITDFNSKNPIWEFVIAIWNALAEYSDTVTLWILSAKWRKLDEDNWSVYMWLYQTDAAINPWNSGWPLINIVWEVIWVNTAITSIWQWIWFSIPINRQFVQVTLESIKKYWSIKRPLLWIYFVEVNKTIAKQFKLHTYQGALVQKIKPNSPAEKVGIKKWDIIVEIDWQKITQDNPIIYSLFTHMVWDTINIMINRDWKLIQKTVTLQQF